jgi:hypothetical protein
MIQTYSLNVLMIQGKSQVNLIKNQHQNYRPFCLARYRLLIHERYTDPTGNFFGVILGIISAVSTNAVIAAIGTKLFLAKIIIAYAVTFECPDDPR